MTVYLSDWNYYKTLTITGSTAGAQSNYVIPIRVYFGSGTDGTDLSFSMHNLMKMYCNGKCKADFSDIRFALDDGTLLDYACVEYFNSNSAIFYIKVDSIPASPNTKSIYIYYGNDDALYIGSLKNTFYKADDFESETLDSNTWTWVNEPTSPSSYSQSNGKFTINSVNTFTELWNNTYTAPQLLTPISESNYEIVTKVRNTGLVSYNSCGILISRDGTNNWVDIIIQWHLIDGRVTAGNITLNGVSSSMYAAPIYDGDTRNLAIRKVGTTYYVYAKNVDDINYYYCGSDIGDFSPNYAGLYLKSATVSAHSFSGIWDWIYIRKFVNPEPTLDSWGTEQEIDRVIVASGTDCSISPSGNVTVSIGNNQTFTITPPSVINGYMDDIVIDSVGVNSYLIREGFEGGNFGSWSTYGVGTKVVETVNPHTETYNAKFITSGDTQQAAISKTISPSSIINSRFFVKINSLVLRSPSNNYVDIAVISGSSSQDNATIRLVYDDDSRKTYWALHTSINGVGSQTILGTSEVSTGTWYMVEFVRDTTNGEAHLWINNTLEISDYRSLPNNSTTVNFGICYQSGSGGVELFIDDIIVNTSRIYGVVINNTLTSATFYNINKNHTINAVAALYNYEITVSSPYGNPQGGGTYERGTNASISVTSPVSGGTGIRYVCTGYSIDNGGSGQQYTGTSYQFTNIQAHHTIYYYWKTQYYLTVSSTHGTTSGAGWYDDDSTAYAGVNAGTISGDTGIRYIFTSWSGDASGTSYNQSNAITMNAPKTATANWTTQYKLTVTGGYSSTSGYNNGTWVNSGSTITSTSNKVWNTVTGQSRSNITHYNIDGGTNTTVTRSNSGTATTSPITMNSAHTVNWIGVTQYKLTVTGGNSISFGSSSPTNDQWYDSGSSTTVSSNGVYNRSSGTGQRISSWKLDSGSNNNVSTTGTVTTSSITMNTYHTITFNSTTQYQVTLDTGLTNGLSSLTSPTIPNDNYWYDSGTSVTVTVNGVYGRTSTSGTRITAYKINGGSNNGVSTVGTFKPLNAVSINGVRTLTCTTVTQYKLTVTGGNGVTYGTGSSISGDTGWYNSGTTTTVSSNWVYNNVTNQSRTVLTNYQIDGTNKNPTRQYSGTLTSSSITMSAAHTVTFVSTTQYYIQITSSGIGEDSSGTVATLAGTANTQAQLPYGSWRDTGSSISYSFSSPVSAGSTKRYVWSSISGLSQTLQSNTFTVSTYGIITGTYITQYSVVSSAGSNATISPSGTIWITSGNNQTFTIGANSGYYISQLLIDGSPDTLTTSYTFSNVTSAHTININVTAYGTNLLADPSFDLSTGTYYWSYYNGLTTGGRTGTYRAYVTGVDSWGGRQIINQRINDITPSTTYSLDGWVCGAQNGGEIQLYIREYNSSNTQLAEHGGKIPCTTDWKHWIKTWNTNANTSYIRVQAYCYDSYPSTKTFYVDDVKLYTGAITYTVTATAGTGGSISPSGVVNVNYGTGSQTFTSTPNTDYVRKNMVKDGSNQGNVSSVTFNSVYVEGNHTVEAYFMGRFVQNITEKLGNIDNEPVKKPKLCKLDLVGRIDSEPTKKSKVYKTDILSGYDQTPVKNVKAVQYEPMGLSDFPVPTDGLKLYLPFNEEEGNVAYDLSGNSNHMSLYGGVTWELADNRYCVSCDGIDDYGRATNLNLLGENEIMTTAWVYVSSAQEVVGWKKSLTYGRTKPAPAYWCAMYIGSGQSATTISSFNMTIIFWHSGDNAGGSVGHYGLPVNRWVHIAWGFDKTLKIAKFYVDGVLVRTTDISSYIDGGYNTCLDESPSSGLHIGEGIGGERLVSKFAHIAVYNRLLDDEEVYKLYTSSSPIINTKTYQSDVLGNKDYTPIKGIDSVKVEKIGLFDDVTKKPKKLVTDLYNFTDNKIIQIPNIVAYWKFDETTGTTLTDYSGNDNDGTLQGTSLPIWTNGLYNGALQFNGSSSNVKVPHSDSLYFDDELTISGWFYPNKLTEQVIICKDKDGGIKDFDVCIRNGKVCIYYESTGSDQWIHSNYVVKLNTWTHFVIVFDSLSAGRMYINGVLDCTWDTTGIQNRAVTTEPIYIGMRGTTYLSHHFEGLIDELVLFNRALTEDEASILVQGPHALVKTVKSYKTDMLGETDKLPVNSIKTYKSDITATEDFTPIKKPKSYKTDKVGLKDYIPIKKTKHIDSDSLGIKDNLLRKIKSIRPEVLGLKDTYWHDIYTNYLKIITEMVGYYDTINKKIKTSYFENVGFFDTIKRQIKHFTKENIRFTESNPFEKMNIQFKEQTGTIAKDISGNNNNLTLHNGTSWEVHEGHHAIVTDGINNGSNTQTARPTNPFILTGEQEMFTSAWIYVPSTQYNTNYKKSLLYGRSRPAPAYWCSSHIETANTATITYIRMSISFWKPTDNTGGGSGSHNISLLNQWVHLAWGFSKITKKAYFYVNGELNRETDISSYIDGGWFTPLDIDPAYNGFVVGSSNGTSEALASKNSDIRIFNRVLSPQEVSQLYNEGCISIPHPKHIQSTKRTIIDYLESSIKNSIFNINEKHGLSDEYSTLNNCIGRWNCDEGEGNIVYDSSSNDNHGIITDGVWSTGKYQKALEFNGSSTMIQMPSNNTYYPPNISFTAWICPTGTSTGDYVIKHDAIYFVVLNYSTTLNTYAVEVNLNINGSWRGRWRANVRIPRDEWSFIGFTYDGTQIVIYVNDNEPSIFTPSVIGNLTSSTGFIIGRRGLENYYKGKINEIQIFNRALSSNEMSIIYNMKLPVVKKPKSSKLELIGLKDNITKNIKANFIDLSGIKDTVLKKIKFNKSDIIGIKQISPIKKVRNVVSEIIGLKDSDIVKQIKSFKIDINGFKDKTIKNIQLTKENYVAFKDSLIKKPKNISKEIIIFKDDLIKHIKHSILNKLELADTLSKNIKSYMFDIIHFIDRYSKHTKIISVDIIGYDEILINVSQRRNIYIKGALFTTVVLTGKKLYSTLIGKYMPQKTITGKQLYSTLTGKRISQINITGRKKEEED